MDTGSKRTRRPGSKGYRISCMARSPRDLCPFRPQLTDIKGFVIFPIYNERATVYTFRTFLHAKSIPAARWSLRVRNVDGSMKTEAGAAQTLAAVMRVATAITALSFIAAAAEHMVGDGVPAVFFFDNCVECPNCLIEDIGKRLSEGIAAKTAALLHLGRFGEVLQIVQTRRKMAEQNGEDPWVFIFREAWLRTLCFDFEGACALSRIIMHSNAEQHAVQPGAIAMVASGYAELDQRKYDAALDCFSRVRDFEITRNFFLHWRWRISAHLRSCMVFLHAGDIAVTCCETQDL